MKCNKQLRNIIHYVTDALLDMMIIDEIDYDSNEYLNVDMVGEIAANNDAQMTDYRLDQEQDHNTW